MGTAAPSPGTCLTFLRTCFSAKLLIFRLRRDISLLHRHMCLFLRATLLRSLRRWIGIPLCTCSIVNACFVVYLPRRHRQASVYQQKAVHIQRTPVGTAARFTSIGFTFLLTCFRLVNVRLLSFRVKTHFCFCYCNQLTFMILSQRDWTFCAI